MTASSTRSLVMGTRGSPLALAQARQFARQLEAAHENLVVEERIIRTTGDKNQISSLPAIGGKGVFTLEIEAALLDGTIDFAVHSLKDLPPDLPLGLTLGCIPKRESAHDVLVLREECEQLHSDDPNFGFPPRFTPHYLRHNARIGTSSLRRRAALLNVRPDLEIEDIRGNIDTRLRKMYEQNFDAIMLAEAGLRRLGFTNGKQIETKLGRCHLHRLFHWRLFSHCVPAPGQGALAIECRQNDNRVLELLSALEDEATRIEISVERAVVRALNAGCSTPLGVYARFKEGKVFTVSCVISPDGKERVDVDQEARSADNAERIGQNVARELLEKGAQKLLATHF